MTREVDTTVGRGQADLPELEAPAASAAQPALTVDVPQLRWRALIGIAVGCVALIAFFARRITLYSDDYMFLDDARRMPFDWEYLSRPLFGHFSPVTRAVDAWIVGLLPDNSWLVFATVLVFGSCVVGSVLALMVALFGRRWPAAIGTAIIGSSLTVLPSVNWFTAATNLLPALAAATLSFAAMVFLIRGRSRWWALVAVLSYSVAVLGWEMAALVPGYALIWLLLFRERVTAESLLAVLRRTWWVWSLLAVIGVATVANYWFNYYNAAPRADVIELVAAMAMSLFVTTLPTIAGFHDPAMLWFTILGTLVGIAVFGYLLVLSIQRSAQAWRGWLFAALGWAVPCAALVLNRVGYYGVTVAEQAIYFLLPSLLLVVGVLEACTATARAQPTGLARQWSSADPRVRRRRVGAVVVLFVVAYAWSAPATIRGTFDYHSESGSSAPDRTYVDNFRSSVDSIGADPSTYSVLDTMVPGGLVPHVFTPYNQLDRVAGIWAPAVRFGAVDGAHWVADDSGRLHQVDIDWTYDKTLTNPGDAALVVTGARYLRADPELGACVLITDPGATVLLPLGRTVTGDQLVVRTLYSVEQPTTARLLAGPPGEPFEAANEKIQLWTPGANGVLDTVSTDALAQVGYDTLEVGATFCLTSVSVGVMTQVN